MTRPPDAIGIQFKGNLTYGSRQAIDVETGLVQADIGAGTIAGNYSSIRNGNAVQGTIRMRIANTLD